MATCSKFPRSPFETPASRPPQGEGFANGTLRRFTKLCANLHRIFRTTLAASQRLPASTGAGGTMLCGQKGGSLMLKFKSRAKAEDRRRSERHAVRGRAKIQLGTGSFPRDCWVTDVSDGGVRLHCEFDLPDEFVLLLPGVDGRRECRVVWRLGHEVGAEFIGPFAQGFARQVTAGRR